MLLAQIFFSDFAHFFIALQRFGEFALLLAACAHGVEFVRMMERVSGEIFLETLEFSTQQAIDWGLSRGLLLDYVGLETFFLLSGAELDEEGEN